MGPDGWKEGKDGERSIQGIDSQCAGRSYCGTIVCAEAREGNPKVYTSGEFQIHWFFEAKDEERKSCQRLKLDILPPDIPIKDPPILPLAGNRIRRQRPTQAKLLWETASFNLQKRLSRSGQHSSSPLSFFESIGKDRRLQVILAKVAQPRTGERPAGAVSLPEVLNANG